MIEARFSIMTTTMCLICEAAARNMSGLKAAPAANPPVVFRKVLRSIHLLLWGRTLAISIRQEYEWRVKTGGIAVKLDIILAANPVSRGFPLSLRFTHYESPDRGYGWRLPDSRRTGRRRYGKSVPRAEPHL